jgi:acetyl-CoA carboxylase carboxyl transferase subunit alpha
MLENTWYSVISPESCSSILWRSWDYKEVAAEQLKLTASHMHKFGLVDGIVREPIGGAHAFPDEMARTLKKVIVKHLAELDAMTPQERIDERIRKFSGMGRYTAPESKTAKAKAG